MNEVEALELTYENKKKDYKEKIKKYKLSYESRWDRFKKEFKIFSNWARNSNLTRDLKEIDKLLQSPIYTDMNIEKARKTEAALKKIWNRISKKTDASVLDVFCWTDEYFSRYSDFSNERACYIILKNLKNIFYDIEELYSYERKLEELQNEHTHARKRIEKQNAIKTRRNGKQKLENERIENTRNSKRESHLAKMFSQSNTPQPTDRKQPESYPKTAFSQSQSPIQNNQMTDNTILSEEQLNHIRRQIDKLLQMSLIVENNLYLNIINEHKLSADYEEYFEIYRSLEVMDNKGLLNKLQEQFKMLPKPAKIIEDVQEKLESNIQPAAMAFLSGQNIYISADKPVGLDEFIIRLKTFTFLTPVDQIPKLVRNQVFNDEFVERMDFNRELQEKYYKYAAPIVFAFVEALQRNKSHLTEQKRQVIESNPLYDRIDRNLVVIEYFEEYNLNHDDVTTIAKLISQVKDKELKSMFYSRLEAIRQSYSQGSLH